MQVAGPIALNHLDRMTDCTGVIQHAIYGVPRARVATRRTTTRGHCACAFVSGISTSEPRCWRG